MLLFGMSDEQNNRHVLVIDENVEDRYNTCMLLHRFGYDVIAALSTQRAIEFMTTVEPAAVVVDVSANGCPFLSMLAQDPRFFDTPVILLSWWSHPELEKRSSQGGIAGYLRKPVDVISLFRTVESAIEKSGRQNIRITSHLPVFLNDGLDGAKGYATIISEYGMFFRTFNPREVHARVPVEIQVKNKCILCEAVVLYRVPFDEGPFKEPGMGMKFVTISRADRKLIEAYILEQINTGGRRENPSL